MCTFMTGCVCAICQMCDVGSACSVIFRVGHHVIALYPLEEKKHILMVGFQ